MTSESPTNGHSAREPSTATGVAAFVESMRVSHWIKNGFVAVPLLFSGKYMEWEAWVSAAMAVLAFCLLASGVYMMNDVCDVKKDRAHPVKRHRPIASGRLSPTAAILGGVGLMLIAFAVTFWVCRPSWSNGHIRPGYVLVGWTAAYLVLNLLYSFWLKRLPVVDVLLVAFGFVLRAMAGAAAIVVPISPWLIVCTLSLTLFIALTKRRSELVELDTAQAGSVREVNRQYTPAMLEFMLIVSSSMAIITYMLYCLSVHTRLLMKSSHMIWTIPLVIYGLFRYNMLTRQTGKNDPVKVLLGDVAMWVVVAAFVVITALILQFGPRFAYILTD